MAFSWKLHGDGKTPPLGEAVAPDERLSWPRTIGIGAQHVVAMFGATFVFPLIMGLDPNLAIMMSGIATIIFLLLVSGRIPSYLGTSASFVGGVFAVRAQGGNSSDVVGAILVSGVVLAIVGMVIHFLGARVVNAVLPPAVTGAVVMLIGFNLAPVVANTYWPQDQWVALATMAFVIICSLLLRGFWARISILLGLVFGYLLSILLDATSGQITSALPGANLLDASGNSCAAAGPYCVATAFPHDRISFSTVGKADWFGLPNFTAPTFSVNFALLVLPAVIALIAENTGHVKAVSAMTKGDLDPVLGRAMAADGGAAGGRRRRDRGRDGGRRPPDDDVRREHRRHGRHPRLLDGGVLRGRDRRDPAGPVPEVRRAGQHHPGRRARRDHRRPLRDDRPARREDLEGEPGRLREPDQSGAAGRGHHHRHRQRDPADLRQLLAVRHRVRGDRDRRRLACRPGGRTRRDETGAAP